MHWFNEIPIGSIAESHLRRLIEERVRESLTIEFKARLPAGGGEGMRREIAKDISCFANASGGDLIYGILEEDKVALDLVGLDGGVDDNERFLYGVAKDAIEPRVALSFHSVALAGGKHVLIVRVPPSLHGPHRVEVNEDRFWMRNAAGASHTMSSSELRQLVMRSETVMEKAELWREQRLRMYDQNLGRNWLARGGYRLFVHGFPLSANADAIPLHTQEPIRRLQQIRYAPTNGLLRNFEGAVCLGSPNYPTDRIMHWFNSGRFEYVEVEEESTADVAGKDIEDTVHSVVAGNIRALSDYVGPSPWFVFVSLNSILGRRYLLTESDERRGAQYTFGDGRIELPGVLVSEFPSGQSLWKDLAPTFHRIAQAANRPGSPWFDETGNRRSKD